MKENKEEIPTFLILIVSICVVFIIIVAIGFAAFIDRENIIEEHEEPGSNIVLKYSTDYNGIKLKNPTPTTDAVGIKKDENGEYFDFSVDVKLDNAPSVEYEISVIKDRSSTIADSDIKLYLEKENSGTYTKVFGPDKYTPLKKSTKLGSKSGSMVLLKTKKTNSSSDNYRLRMWLSETSTTQTGDYGVMIVVNAISK